MQRWRRPLDYLFRYDFFVSYRWSDARLYATRLRDELERRGFVVFLDSSDYAKGDNWREEGVRALRRSSRLLLIGSPDVFDSDPVFREVEIFTALQRRVLPIDIGGTLESARSSQRLVALLPPEILRFREPSLDCLSDGPTTAVIDDIINSFELIRQHARRLRLLLSIIAVLVCLIVAAVGAGIYADTKRRQAIVERDNAEWQRLVAEGGQANATLDDPTQWATGLALATSSALGALRSERDVPDGLRFALLRALWQATPYVELRVKSRGAARFLGDGRVAVIGEHGSVQLIDPGSGASTTLDVKGQHLAVSADGTRLVIRDESSMQVVRSDGTVVRRIGATVSLAAFGPGDEHVLGATDKMVRRWALHEDGEPTVVFQGDELVLAIAASSRGDIAIVDNAVPGSAIRIIAAAGQVRVLEDPDPPTRTISAVFSVDGSRLLTSDQIGQVRVWDVETGKRIRTRRTSSEIDVTDAAFSPDATSVVSGSYDTTIDLWNLLEGRGRRLYGHTGPIVSVAFSPDGSRLLSSSEDGTVRLWSVRPSPDLVVLEGRTASSCGQSVTSAGHLIATTTNRAVRVSDTRTGNVLATLPGNATSVAISPDGRYLVATQERAPPVLWDVNAKARVRVFDGLAANQVAFARSSDRLFVAGARGLAGIWSFDGRGERLRMPSQAAVRTIASSDDDGLVATAGADGRVRIWNVLNAALHTELDGHTVFTNSACFARDRQRVVSAGGDRRAFVWDLASRTRVLSLAGHADEVMSALFSNDQRFIYTSSHDATVRIWDAMTGDLVGRLNLPEPTNNAFELPDQRLAVSMGAQTWIGSLNLRDITVAACTILAPLDSVTRVPATTLDEVHRGCASLAR